MQIEEELEGLINSTQQAVWQRSPTNNKYNSSSMNYPLEVRELVAKKTQCTKILANKYGRTSENKQIPNHWQQTAKNENKKVELSLKFRKLY